jgi:hypothetical protein
MIDQDISGLGRDEVFLRIERVDDHRHAERDAAVAGEIALSASGLVGEARLEQHLVLGRERRLLQDSPALGLIERRLADKPADDEPVPLPLQVGVLRLVEGLGVARGQPIGQQRGERDSSDEAAITHDVPLMIFTAVWFEAGKRAGTAVDCGCRQSGMFGLVKVYTTPASRHGTRAGISQTILRERSTAAGHECPTSATTRHRRHDHTAGAVVSSNSPRRRSRPSGVGRRPRNAV